MASDDGIKRRLVYKIDQWEPFNQYFNTSKNNSWKFAQNWQETKCTITHKISKTIKTNARQDKKVERKKTGEKLNVKRREIKITEII